MRDTPAPLRHAAGATPEAALASIAALVEARYGITFHGARRPLLGSRVRELLAARAMRSIQELHAHLVAPQGNQPLWNDLIARIVTRETSFFRQEEHFAVLRDVILPAAISNRSFDGIPEVRILSAGCATGQEAYSLAMMLQESPELLRHANFAIDACDLDEEALRSARAAEYAEPELRGLSAERRARFTVPSGDRLRIADNIRSMVRFFRHNLLDALPGTSYDAIFCRNVTIYFDAGTTERVAARLAEALHPGGHLFCGHSETLRGTESALRPIPIGNAIVYRRARVSLPDRRRPA